MLGSNFKDKSSIKCIFFDLYENGSLSTSYNQRIIFSLKSDFSIWYWLRMFRVVVNNEVCVRECLCKCLSYSLCLPVSVVWQAVNDLVTQLEQANITCRATITFAENDFQEQLNLLKVQLCSPQLDKSYLPLTPTLWELH